MTESILTVNQFPAFYQAWEENLKNILEVSETEKVETTDWIRKMPKILSFMLNRIEWEDGNPTKKNGKMEIEKQIYPDRFLEKNYQNSLRIREEVNIFRNKAEHLKKCLNEYQQFGEDQTNLMKALSAT